MRLSETTLRGRANVADNDRKVLIIVADVVVICFTSSHFVYVSTITRNEHPLISPAKSMCRVCYGLSGLSYSRIEALDGVALTSQAIL